MLCLSIVVTSSNVRALLLRREGIKEGGKFPSNVHGARVLPIWAQWLEIEKRAQVHTGSAGVGIFCKLDLLFSGNKLVFTQRILDKSSLITRMMGMCYSFGHSGWK